MRAKELFDLAEELHSLPPESKARIRSLSVSMDRPALIDLAHDEESEEHIRFAAILALLYLAIDE